MSKYPVHDKLEALNGKNQVVGEFIKWIKSNPKFVLCELNSNQSYDNQIYTPVQIVIEEILAEYFEFDLEAYYKEKDEALKEYRLMSREIPE